MRSFVRNNSLGLFFGVLFVGTLAAQSVAGWQSFNDEHVGEQLGTIGYGAYVTSTDFAVAVAENWQSEFLQFLLYVLATVWFLQQGSPESKELDKPGLETDEEQKVGAYAGPDPPRWAALGGWRTRLYSHSLALAVGVVFLLSWLAQSVAGWASENEHRLEQLRDPQGWGDYASSADFWERTLQNWQSEFLAVGAFAVLAIFLRERGSAESKPVGEPHSSTGVEG
ncbi:hypothetical protein FHP29_00585 [Nocardioides albidus]|uniref:Uncharacterized protein n=1 Tax=Nocardioides albidus TaxID=1517589 RepID=A0A5C4WPT7_9ACTN|nr:DUF6766 family protein [Nocardioides albidus]TNM50257.1 hypothetical protein FHP29_00585 [Nocardioides albidus]